MKKTIFAIIGLALLLTAKVYAYDDGDFQVWNTDVEELKINNELKLAFEEEFRWGDNAHEFYYHHYDVGFFYNLEKWLNIGGGYRHVYELKKGKFKLENKPYITATLLWYLKGLKFEDPSRLEYRHFDFQADFWRYRNKPTLKLPWKFTPLEKLTFLPYFLTGFTKMEIQPYLSDEIFVGLGGTSQFNQNRFTCGLGMNLTKNVKAEIYYMLQSTKSSRKWVDANVLGTKLKVVF